MLEWMILPLWRYVEFGGRSRRKEFWLFALLVVAIWLLAGAADTALGYGSVERHEGRGSWGILSKEL